MPVGRAHDGSTWRGNIHWHWSSAKLAVRKVTVWQAGENNARVQSAAVDALLSLAAIPDAALSSQAPLFLKPEKQTQWKRILGRCTLVP